MKKLNVFLASALSTLALTAAEIEEVIVRQQWPWSTDIKVEYALSGLEAGQTVDLTVKAYDGGVELDASRLAQSIKGAVYGIAKGEEVGSFTIDPVKAFGTDKVALTDFSVKLSVADTPDSMNEVLYRVYDLDNGSVESITRKALLNGEKGPIVTDYKTFGSDMVTPDELKNNLIIWTDVTNNPVYKTSKLVMRKIPAGGKVWQCGDPDDTITKGGRLSKTAQKFVKLSQDYFVSVFEITQAQYRKIYGSNPSSFTSDPDAEHHPVENVYFYNVAGNPNATAGSSVSGVLTGEPICWPTNSILHDVGKGTFLAKLRSKTNVEFDLPTSAQWEYACGARSSTPIYSGSAQSEDAVASLAWYNNNAGSKTHAVGLKVPNGFGLYDMLGNVVEYTYNSGATYDGASAGDGGENTPYVDPVGRYDTSTGATYRQVRGGAWSDAPGYWMDLRTASVCAFYLWTKRETFIGFRVVCPVEAQWPRN